MAQVIQLPLRSRRRSLAAAAESQALYARILTNAEAARRRDFTLALEHGVCIEELAQAVGLAVDDVAAVLTGRGVGD